MLHSTITALLDLILQGEEEQETVQENKKEGEHLEEGDGEKTARARIRACVSTECGTDPGLIWSAHLSGAPSEQMELIRNRVNQQEMS